MPSADFNLAGDDWIYFSHHHVLWTEPTVQLQPMSHGRRLEPGAGRPAPRHAGGHRARAPRPLRRRARARWSPSRSSRARPCGCGSTASWPPPATSATPGSSPGIWIIDRQRRRPGDPLPARHVRRHLPGPRRTRAAAAALAGQHVHPGPGLRRDHLHPAERPALQGPERRHAAAHRVPAIPAGLNFTARYSYRQVWLRLWGPGRVAVQSVFERPEASNQITSHSPATTTAW